MSGGPSSFTVSQPFQDDPACVMDGVVINVSSQFTKTPSGGANILGMGDQSNVVQPDWRDADRPEILEFYNFSLPQRAVSEDSWWKVAELRAFGRPFWMTDFDYVTEVFSAGPELTAFRLTRFTAAFVWASFPVTYPIFAKLNGATQTIIDSGSPASGEIKIVGRDVTTPGLANGDHLVIRYVPSYYVAFNKGLAQQYRGGNDATRSIELIEARSFAPPAPPE